MEAIEAIRLAVKEEPEEPEYKQYLETCKRNATKQLIEDGQGYLESEQLFRAEYAAKRASELSPANDAAKKLQGQVDKLKKAGREQVQKTKDMLDEGKYDEAVLLLSKYLKMATTFPEIKQIYQTAKLYSFDFHVLQGIHLFELFDYEGARKEFEIAHKDRLPNREDGRAWLEKADNHLKAQKDSLRAEQLFAKGEYEESYERFCRALGHVPDFRIALKGREKALYHWTDEVYMDARSLEGQAVKPALYNSLDTYLRCEKLIAGFKDVPARIKYVHQRLAELFLEEGDYFAGQPNLRNIGMAHYCYSMAKKHDPSIERLPTVLPKVERLFQIRRRVPVRVDIKGEGEYPLRVVNALVDAINKENYPDVDAAMGRMDGLHKQMDDEAVATGAELGLEWGELNVPYSILQIGGTVSRDFAKKTGAQSPLLYTSSYISHSEAVPNPEYENAVVQNQHWSRVASAADRELDGLRSDQRSAASEHSRRSQDHSVARANLTTKQTQQQAYFNTANSHDSKAKQYRSQASEYRNNRDSANRTANDNNNQARQHDANAQRADAQRNAQLAAQYRRQAEICRDKEKEYRSKANQYDQQARSADANAAGHERERNKYASLGNDMNSEVRALSNIEQQAAGRLREAEAHLQGANSAVSDSSNRRGDARSTASHWAGTAQSVPSQVSIGIATSYGFKHYELQVFGRVKTDLYVMDEHGKVIKQRPETDVAKKLQDVMHTGVSSSDINNFGNDGDDLPSAESLHEDLRVKAIGNLIQDLDEFFSQYNKERFYDLARVLLEKEQELPAAEAYCCFLASGGSGREATEAREFLDQLSRNQLK